MPAAAPPAAADVAAVMPEDARPRSLRRRAVQVSIVANLDFALLTANGAGGAARVAPDGSSAETRGGVRALGGMAFGGRALIEGEPLQPVRVTLPQQITMVSSSGGRLTVRNISSNLPAAPRLDAAGRLEFGFGGDLEVSGAVSGTYRGRIEVTAEYD